MERSFSGWITGISLSRGIAPGGSGPGCQARCHRPGALSRRRRHHVIVDLADAVRLRPHAHLPRHRRGQRVVEELLAVEVALQLRAVDGDLHRVPLLEGDVDVLDALFDEAALALVEGPEHEVVFLAVEADRQETPFGFRLKRIPAHWSRAPPISLKRMEISPSWKSSTPVATA